jgi:site-specific DNA-methyltransferase (adenine-specific)
MTAPAWSIHHGEAWGWLRSLESGSAGAIVTDPPYSSGGFTRGDRTADPRAKYRTNDASAASETASFDGDNRDQRSFALWLAFWLTEARRVVADGGVVAVATDWRQLPTVCDAIQVGGFVWRGILVWTKRNATRPQRGRFRADAEFFVWGSAGALPVDGPVLPGTVDTFASAEVSCAPVTGSRRLHLTEKPVEVMEAVLGIVRPGRLVIDPFAGSGSTGVGCLRRGLPWAGCELAAENVAIIRRRMAAEAMGVDGTAAARDGQASMPFGGAE